MASYLLWYAYSDQIADAEDDQDGGEERQGRGLHIEGSGVGLEGLSIDGPCLGSLESTH